MTKVIILGEATPEKKKKPIEFIKYLDRFELKFNTPSKEPIDCEHIELVCKNFDQFDLMFAYNDDRSKGVLYFGHFNDGVVE